MSDSTVLRQAAPGLSRRVQVLVELDPQRTSAGDGERVDRGLHLGDAYERQLDHSHACVLGGERCLTPPEQARLDLLALRDAFLVASRA